MSLLAASSSVADFFPPGPMALGHSRNVNGDFGSFVAWWSCPCHTCTDYRAERAAEERPETPTTGTPIGAGAALGPSATGADLGLSQISYAPLPGGVALARAPANHVWTGSDWVHQDSAYARSVAMAPYLAPPVTPSLTRSLTLGIGGADPRLVFGRGASVQAAPAPAPAPAVPEVVEEAEESSDSEEETATIAASEAPEAPGLRGVDPEEDAIMARLQGLRARLLVQQDNVYSTECRSHDEMAAQDVEWDDLDNKIDAIEQLLQAFGVVFRTR